MVLGFGYPAKIRPLAATRTRRGVAMKIVSFMVPKDGLEPSRALKAHSFLRATCLPIPPLRRTYIIPFFRLVLKLVGE